MTLKLIHTADWQIGKPFGNFHDEAAVLLREQRINTIKTIAARATELTADAVLVAGDIFDSYTIRERTVLQTVGALAGFSGPWLLLPGNHDPALAEGVWRDLHRMDLPANIYLLDSAQPVEIAGGKAVVLPAPLQRKHDSTDVTEWFDTCKTAPDVIRIGLAHGSVDDRLPDRGDAPNTVSARRAEKADLDYLALGDWHGTHPVNDKTWYSGTPETDRFKANDSGNILLIEIEAHGKKPTVQKIPTGRYRWHNLEPQVTDEQSAEDLEKLLISLGEPRGDLVLQISPRGTASLQTRHLLTNIVRKWDADVRYLEYREDNLLGEASAEDLETLGTSGFISDAVQELQSKTQSENPAEAEAARLALQILFFEQKQLASKR